VRKRAIHPPRPHPWLAVLLLVALVTRALVPVGYMPAPGGGAMLCPAYAPVIAQSSGSRPTQDSFSADMPGMDMRGMDMSGHSGHGGVPSGHDGTAMCPFATAAASVAITHAPLLLAAYTTESFSPETYLEQPVPRTRNPPTRLPRGPPVVA